MARYDKTIANYTLRTNQIAAHIRHVLFVRTCSLKHILHILFVCFFIYTKQLPHLVLNAYHVHRNTSTAL